VPRRYITQKAISASATNLIPKDSLIVVTRVGLGKLFYNNFDVCISQDSQGLILKKDRILPLFALFILADKVKQFKTESQGSTIQGVTKKQLSDILIPLPTMQKQHEIVRQLESELSFIETSKQMIELYKHKINVTIAKLWEN
jgi:restriction endonuclease S subunit